MEMTRRQMMTMSALAAATFLPLGRAALAAASETRQPIDAGTLADFEKEGIYPQFYAQGFFIIHQGTRLVAQSSRCTHRGCKLTADPTGFHCKCHGAAFTIDGKVTKPPAKADLPRHSITLNDDGHILVDLSHTFKPTDFNTKGAYIEVPAKQA
jgi:Rieske Fe-S protein